MCQVYQMLVSFNYHVHNMSKIYYILPYILKWSEHYKEMSQSCTEEINSTENGLTRRLLSS